MSVAESTGVPDVRRPRRADAARNYDALIDAGRTAFAEHGSGAALEDVARRAGVGIGTLYRNFPTRDDLIEALYVREVVALAEAGQELQSLSPREGLDGWLARFVQYIGTKRALVEGLTRDSDVMAQCRATMYASGEPLLTRAQESGDADPDLTISDVVRLVAGVTAAAYENDAQRDRVLAAALRGIHR
ncbi:helix-turn-helix domain-containing protein [Microbacterium sp. X-17]|uniref:TetR/AcrR family transcriptional regulator n=1 Tax=Microbacterium sp. X-17 TaxID=3144404 RepID=UPI0031F4BCCE